MIALSLQHSLAKMDRIVLGKKTDPAARRGWTPLSRGILWVARTGSVA